MLSLRIAARFLRKSPVQSALLAGGIAIGIAAQIFVGSLITSLQSTLINETIGSAPHITLQNPKTGDPVTYSARVQQLLSTSREVAPGTIVPVRQANALYTNGTDNAPLNLIGGDLAQLDGIYKLSDHVTAGKASLGPGEIMIGADFAKKYNLKPGDSMQLTFQGQQATDFTVSGVYDLGVAALNSGSAFVNGNVARDLYGWSNNQYSAIYLQLLKPFDSAKVAAQWSTQLQGVEILDWQSQNASLLVGLQSQTSSSIMIQGFVLIAVALGIASTLAISAVQKTRQIGILKAMGMRDGNSGLIFLYEALILGVSGSVAGVILAFVLIGLFSLAPLTFKIVPQPSFVLLSAAIGIGVAVGSSIVPSRRTSKLDPIEVIQSG